MKEACFDIQIWLLEFFTSAVEFMRGKVEDIYQSNNWHSEGLFMRATWYSYRIWIGPTR